MRYNHVKLKYNQEQNIHNKNSFSEGTFFLKPYVGKAKLKVTYHCILKKKDDWSGMGY